MPTGFKYVWLIWSSAFTLLWLMLYALAPGVRRIMLNASLLTVAFGLTEPIFVPAYWNPPTLFNLAQRTGFDIESLIFCFAIGGIGVAWYGAVSVTSERVVGNPERHSGRHRWHLLALITPFPIFLLLLTLACDPICP